MGNVDSVRLDVIDIELELRTGGERAVRSESLGQYLSRLEMRLDEREQRLIAVERSLATVAASIGVEIPLMKGA